MQIESGIPIPVKRNWKKDLDKMEVSQSAPIENEFLNSVKAAISQHFHSVEEGKRFTTAKESETHFRVWRTK